MSTKNLAEKKWLSPAETATYVGLHVVTTRRLIGKGTIPGAKLGGRLLVNRELLDQMLQQQIESRSGRPSTSKPRS